MTSDQVAELTAGLDIADEDRVHLLATLILLTGGGPLADRFEALPPSDVHQRRVFLQETLAWRAAEMALK